MIRIDCMNIEEVKQERYFTEQFLLDYQRHNIHGCFEDRIREKRVRLDRCDKRIEELEKC